jgi:hypothetical protein
MTVRVRPVLPDDASGLIIRLLESKKACLFAGFFAYKPLTQK